MYITIIMVIICALIIYVFIKNSKKKIKKYYSCEEGEFDIVKEKEKFIISKNGNFEFIVKNGKIISCKDKRNSENIIYYGGEI